MKICISSESTIDLTKELLDKYNIKTVPFTVILGDKQGLDGDITSKEIQEYVDENGVLPKTSAVNAYQFEEHFKSLLKDYDAVIHISLSSEISSAYKNALDVSKQMKNVYVIDSKSLSTGIALLAIYASELTKEKLSPQEIVDKVTSRIKSLQVSFVINTLDYLYKGGRCTGVQRFGAMILRIKPQIIMNHEGKMVTGKSFRGKNSQVVRQYCEETLEEFNTPDKSIVFVTHCLASPDMVEAAKEVLKEHGFTNIHETFAGATISSHCGPKTLGILYINDGK